MNILFMGTPEFAVPSFRKIIFSKHNIVGAFTQPDKPKGRGYKLSFSAVKEEALKQNIKVYQPPRIKDPEVINIIKGLNPDVIVVVAYGKILPKEIIDFPKYGCINVHASLLPKYRGAAPIQWSIINGEKITGITTMYMNEGLDTGDIILKKSVEIEDNETSNELSNKLSIIGANLLLETLDLINIGELYCIKQNNEDASYAPMINRSLSWIDWNKSAKEIHDLVRGLNSWPSATTKIDGKIFKIHKTKVYEEKIENEESGKIISISPFVVSCGYNTLLEIIELQCEGKKRMLSSDFLRGHKLTINTKLGE